MLSKAGWMSPRAGICPTVMPKNWQAAEDQHPGARMPTCHAAISSPAVSSASASWAAGVPSAAALSRLRLRRRLTCCLTSASGRILCSTVIDCRCPTKSHAGC